jgi:hypothetical protein
MTTYSWQNKSGIHNIQLCLDEPSAKLLIQILEAFACEIDDTDSWSGGKTEDTINLIDYINSVTTLCLKNEETDEEVGAGWLKI